MTKIGLASSATALVLLTAVNVSAQQQYTAQADSPTWLKDRRLLEGVGIHAGDLELHPSIAGEVGYDSNWFQRSSQQNVDNGPPVAPVIPALEFRITPALYLSTLAGSRRGEDSGPEDPIVAFRAGVNATYRAFIGLTSDSSQTNNDIAKQQNVGGSADARLDITPRRVVNGAVFVNYGRVILPNAGNADPNVSFNQDTIGAGAEVGIQPGEGTLDWHFGYLFSTTLFEQSQGQPFSNYTSQAYTRGRWRFRPRTALLYDGTISWYNYANTTQSELQGLVSGQPLRARIGLSGLVTDRFAVLAMGGWGATFFDDKVPAVQQFDSFIAQAELKWFLAASPGIQRATDVGLALSSVAVGFTRDFQTSYLGNYDTLDRGYLRLDYLFAQRVAVSLQGGVGAVEYPTLYWLTPPATGSGLRAVERGPGFTDVIADASVFSEYRFTPALGLNATFRYTQTFSNTTVADVNPNTGVSSGIPGATGVSGPFNRYGMAWQRFEAYLGVRFFL